MKVFMGFLLVCFFAGWLMNKLSMKQMTFILLGLSMMVAFGYFFLGMI
ncbi:hypothetical protein EKD04_012165 [Chloroflexales bacterium ZM16-3]|nr:hypothetical protein [Chloroflexales bacterium ZM16-3]